jgi:hypothetical protein
MDDVRGQEVLSTTRPSPESATTARQPGRVDYLFVPACLVVAAALATIALFGDSMTFDEAAHLTAGMSHWKGGDFRLLPETPPLAQMWAAAPLLMMNSVWLPPDAPGWLQGDTWMLQRIWLFRLNDGERLLAVARGTIVVLLVVTCLCVFLIAKRLFGPAAGRLALILAALSPTLLAHGHLVTMDIPATLCFLLTLLAVDRLLQRMTWLRLVAATAALAALALVKFSWPLILPALAVMALLVVVRAEPMECPLLDPLARRRSEGGTTRLVRRHHRVAAILAAAVLGMAGVWASIWTCYHWRYRPFPGADQPTAVMQALARQDQPQPTTMAEAWEIILEARNGQPNRSLTASLVRWARDRRLLPEAYLYGTAWVLKLTDWWRPQYLGGETSYAGWYSYFPIAFLLKTPIATMLLFLGGLAAIVSGRALWRRDAVLLVGLSAFSVVYVAVAIVSRFNIGHRHLVPIYPAVFVFAGAAAGWMRWRPGRWAVAAAVLWLAGANAWICPQYLSYFNELIGGPSQGDRYLTDSNIDWGQDLKRLAAWVRRHPGEEIKLAYFGSADPTCYGFPCRALPSYLDFGELAVLDAGTYVVSVSQIHGLYYMLARREFWTPEQLAEYRSLRERVTRPVPEHETAEGRQQRLDAAHWYDLLRRGRLLNQLRSRPPDERIGYSLLVYRLTQADVDALIRP